VVLWDVKFCTLVQYRRTEVSKGPVDSIISTEVGGSKFLRNLVCIYYTASHSRRL
jgi:hypothetical protein